MSKYSDAKINLSRLWNKICDYSITTYYNETVKRPIKTLLKTIKYQ